MTGPCVVWIAGAGADYASTRYAAGRGGLEANPLQGQGPLRQAAIQAGSAGAGCWADAQLRRRGKPGLARGLRLLVLAVKIGLVAHNLKQTRRMQ